MKRNHHAVWPTNQAYDVPKTQTTLYQTLADAERDHPDKTGLIYYDRAFNYREMHDIVDRIAGYLQSASGVRPGDRVAIYAQNCPHYMLAFYAILRAGAVVVPINPMNLESETRYILGNAGINTIFVAQELVDRISGAMNAGQLKHGIRICYSDYMPGEGDDVNVPGLADWSDVIGCEAAPAPYDRTPDDIAIIPYTSGSTGRGKGCVHTNASALHAARSVYDWFGFQADDVYLSVAPMFHVVGLQCGLIVPVATAATTIILPRWDREAAAQLMAKYAVTVWPTVPTMIIDFVNFPGLEDYDLSNLHTIFGGGIAMPDAVANRLHDLTGLTFLEGYGMTETIAPTTANPREKPKTNCVGIPVFNTDVIIVEPDTATELPVGEVGEILISGPQVMREYWQNDKANQDAFATIDGQRFVRSGDLGRVDEQGYVYIVDRIKRMINASGYKVWPAEVEAKLYHHPNIAEVCVISTADPYRGETVKALVVLRPGAVVTDKNITKWAQGQMAAYKVPRVISFVDALPKSGSGKVLWRDLQLAENANTYSAKD
jgi:fatty-acyl-CoA synthase